MNDDLTDEERSAQVRNALLQALAVVVVIGVLIAIGTTIMVRALDLNDDGTANPIGSPEPANPLPTTALPNPDEPSSSPSDQPSKKADEHGRTGRIDLDISPINAKPMERVNLTGTYKGADNVQLEVQRFEDGRWSNFGVQASVNVGTFATYVMTGRQGENRFRVFDPKADEGSNVIMVTIG
jgi:hypothetical protein